MGGRSKAYRTPGGMRATSPSTDDVDSDSVYERKDDLTLSLIISLETTRARAFLNGFSIGRLTGAERVIQATIQSCLAASGRHERVDEFD